MYWVIFYEKSLSGNHHYNLDLIFKNRSDLGFSKLPISNLLIPWHDIAQYVYWCHVTYFSLYNLDPYISHYFLK